MKYLTTIEVEDIMNNLDRLEAFKCLGRMNDYLIRYEHELYIRQRVKYGL